MADPLILTLEVDDRLFACVDRLRKLHFPAGRNFLSAHVTMFHHLPGDRLDGIADDLRDVCERTPSFEVVLSTLRFLGKGVAINLVGTLALGLRSELAERWDEWLIPQDRQKFAPHVTIQNKVDPATARALFQNLSESWAPVRGRATGVSLWHYRGGPWEPAGRFAFKSDG